MKENMEIESRPKVLALYEAVIKLLDEEADINTLKVSDITDRAGIGKGTAYDYFKSREEIISGAIVYEVACQSLKNKDMLDSFPDFEGKIHYLFDWVLNCAKERNTFVRFLALISQSCGIREEILKKAEKFKEGTFGPLSILRELCGYGKAEGYLRSDLSAAEASYILLGSMIGFIMYLENPDGKKENVGMAGERMKELFCSNFLNQIKG